MNYWPDSLILQIRKDLIAILLVVPVAAIASKWRETSGPFLMLWYNKIWAQYIMEKISWQLAQLETYLRYFNFIEKWFPVLEYMANQNITFKGPNSLKLFLSLLYCLLLGNLISTQYYITSFCLFLHWTLLVL